MNTETLIMYALRSGPLTEAAVAAKVGVSIATASRRLRELRPNVRKKGRVKVPHTSGIAAALWELA